MDLVKQIGRYEFPIMSVVATIRRDDGMFDVMLPQGVKLELTEDEKRQLDEAREEYAIVMQVYGMCRGVGLRT